jgi:hypothetical protein
MTLSYKRAGGIRRSLSSLCATLLVAGVLAGCGGDDNNTPTASADVQLKTLSGRPDTVSGGDTLIQVDVSGAATLQSVKVSLNDADVTDSFHPSASGTSLIGLVSGLTLGANTLKATASGNASKELDLTNYPITGPIISGPHQTPFICQTQVFGLGNPLDADCSAATRVEYLYRTTAPMNANVNPFKPYDPSAPAPADLAQTTTSTGVTVPFILRRETGTVNRAVYQIAFLHQPGQPLPTPWTSIPGYNNRLVYAFGGGCNAGYRQGAHAGTGIPGTVWDLPNGVPQDVYMLDYILKRGYAMAVSSLNVFGNNCDETLSAETMMMVKERFIKEYGAPAYTIGNGPSGGSLQQHLIAHSYPGLLDGILPTVSFPDTLTFLENSVTDCVLLDNAFNTSSATWTDAQKGAVAGYHSWNYCSTNGPTWRTATLVPTACDPASMPPGSMYNATSNPKGARCTYADNLKNVYGTDPATGFALRPLDNVGVQYGLSAFVKGTITADQFIDLNKRAGGYDIDGNLQAARMTADPKALDISYQTGRLDSGGGGLAQIPIIDVRSYNDDTDDVHDAVRSDIMKARLIKANGNDGNEVRLIGEGTGQGVVGDILDFGSPVHQALFDALDAMDVWLANISADTAPAATPLVKVTRNKPSTLVDGCYLRNGQKITDFAQCLQMFPSHANPRLAAGEPMTQDYLKCNLKPVARADYPSTLTDAQFASLSAAFPSGVCDYSKPAVGQVPFTRPWLAFPQPGLGTSLAPAN